MLRLRHQAGLKSSLRLIALVAFVGYCFWQAYWLIKGRLAPSLLSYYTGLPNPGSGIMRSIEAALAGNYRESFLYNPFTAPFLALLVCSFCLLLLSWYKKRKLLLPAIVGKLWFTLLACSWLAKFIIGKKYW